MPAYIDSLNALAARMTAGGGMAADPNSPWMQNYVNQRANQPYWDPTAVNSAWAGRGPYDSNNGYHPDLARYWGNTPGGWDAQGGQGQYATMPTAPTMVPSTPAPTPVAPQGPPQGPYRPVEESVGPQGPPPLQTHTLNQSLQDAMNGPPPAAPQGQFGGPLDGYMAHQNAAAQAAGMGGGFGMMSTGGGGGASMQSGGGGASGAEAIANMWFGQMGNAHEGNPRTGPDGADGWGNVHNSPAFQNYEAFRSRQPRGQGQWGQPQQGQGQWGQPPAQQPPYGQPQPPRYNGGNTAGVWG